MFYSRTTPQPPLAAFVSCLWYSEGLQGTHERERLLPNGESCIVIDLRDSPVLIYDAQNISRYESFAPAIFCGARTDCFVIDTSRQERVIGVQFRPGGAFPFLSMPAGEAANNTYSLDDIWPGQTERIRDALMNAPDVPTMFAILERALLSQMKRTSQLHPAIVFAVRSLGRAEHNTSVRDVADRVGFSSRRFLEMFRDQTGLTPKAFQRVRRFQYVLNSLRARGEENWTTLAYRCGYFDQAHFIHDFRLFSGMTPSEYMAVATPHLNHVPLK